MSISQKTFIKTLSTDPFHSSLDVYLYEQVDLDPLQVLTLAVKRLQSCFAFVKEKFSKLNESDYTYYNATITTTLFSVKNAMFFLEYPESNYCKIILKQYLAYFRESLEDYGWIFKAKYLPREAAAIKKIFNRVFGGEHSARNTPFVNCLEATLESFHKFCSAIYLDTNRDLNADTVEILLLAIKEENIPKMNAILTKDHSLLTRVYALNNSIDELGFTPLMYAVKHHHVNIVRDGLFVTLKGKKEILIYIFNKLKDENSSFIGYDLVMIAARWGKSDTFAYLLQFITTRVVIARLDLILKALIHPYIYNDEAIITLQKIYVLLKNERFDDDRFEDLLNNFIFSDNVNLVSKLKSIYSKLSASNSPNFATDVITTSVVHDSKVEVETSPSRLSLFAISPSISDEGPRYPSRKRKI
jgi:hypothetical protein